MFDRDQPVIRLDRSILMRFQLRKATHTCPLERISLCCLAGWGDSQTTG